MLHAAVSIFVGIWEGMGPAHASEAGLDPPFQTRALGNVGKARPGSALREALTST